MRSEAAWQRMALELGRIYGEMISAQITVSERDAVIAELRQQLAKKQDALQKEAES